MAEHTLIVPVSDSSGFTAGQTVEHMPYGDLYVIVGVTAEHLLMRRAAWWERWLARPIRVWRRLRAKLDGRP